jgi:hypothetical protein
LYAAAPTPPGSKVKAVHAPETPAPPLPGVDALAVPADGRPATPGYVAEHGAPGEAEVAPRPPHADRALFAVPPAPATPPR